jgi:hypothetical protein
MGSLRICVAAMILCSMSLVAQTSEVQAKPISDEDVKLLRQDLQAAKNDIITHTMQLNTKESAAFWPIYKDYSSEQHSLADKRLGVITEYAQNIDKLEDAKANSLTERMFQIEDETQALRKKYYPKFVTALGAKRAAKFYQVDNRLTMMTNVQLASEIPLIP